MLYLVVSLLRPEWF
nr:hypothetical protein [Actinomycetospora corticicola]